MEYEFDGLIKVRGCSFVKFRRAYPVLFLNGSKAYIKNKALRGKLEFVIIKNSFLNSEQSYTRSGIQPVVAYIDTFNRAWVEEELTYEEDALDLAEAFWLRVNYEADYVNDRTCNPN